MEAERLLVDACRGEDTTGAYGELVKRHSRSVFAVCLGTLGNVHDAEDEEANLLLKGLDFSQSMKAGGDWQYAGAGVKLGDKKTPVCWWKPKSSVKYRILYGDLRVADIDKADLPKAPQ